MLTGFIRTMNEYLLEDAASSYLALNGQSKNLNIILNCNQKEVDTYLKFTVPTDTIEFGISNNIMNMVYPHSYDLKLNSLINRIMMFNPEMYDTYEKYSLRSARGLIRLTKSGQLLDQIGKKEGFLVPNIKSVKNNETGEDIMRISSSLFVEFQDYTNKTLYDITVAPVDAFWDIKATITDKADGS
jgi:hypothetical protein